MPVGARAEARDYTWSRIDRWVNDVIEVPHHAMVKQQKPVGAIVRSVPVGVGRWCSWLPPGLCGDDRGAFTLPSRITLRVAAPIKLVTTSRHGPRECFFALCCSKGRNPPARGKETGTVVGPVHLIFWESVCRKLNSSGFYQSSSFRDGGLNEAACGGGRYAWSRSKHFLSQRDSSSIGPV